MMLEQERRHWLLKTSAINQVQDKITGDMFRGRIENLGSDIIVETEKLPTTDVLVHDGTFSAENVSDVFEIAKSGLPFIPKLNGLHFTRLTSINLFSECVCVQMASYNHTAYPAGHGLEQSIHHQRGC